MRRIGNHLFALIVPIGLSLVSLALGAQATPAYGAVDAGSAVFQISGDASRSFSALWAESVGAKQERVACIGGRRSGGVAYITRVQEVTVAASDTFNMDARQSLEQCRPPQWFGTVHTHIAKYDGVHPYSTFSGADRGVMAMWNHMWNTVSVFCVLYTEHEAHCESGSDLSADTMYARQSSSEDSAVEQRGNVILPDASLTH